VALAQAPLNTVVIGLIAYLVLQLALGLWVSRRLANETDYLLAGRSLGYVLTTFSVFATWFGAETCIGAAGAAYSGGLAAVTAEPFGYMLAILLFGLFVAAPLWRKGLTTLADLFRLRFGVAAERAAVLLLVPSSVLWAAAQVRAFGQVLGHVSGLDLELSLSIAALVVILYTTAGGLLADAWTDLVQGLILIIGLGAVLIAMLLAGDHSTLSALPADALQFGFERQSTLEILEAWAPAVLGSLVAQELAQRAMAARSVKVARRAPLVAAFLYLGIGLIPVLVGLMAIGATPGLGNPEQVLLVQADRHLGTFAYVIFAGALISAILSTVDTALLVSGGLIAHNIVAPLRPGLSESAKLRASRLAVAACGLVAWGLSFSSESVYALVEQSTALGSTGALVAFAFCWLPRYGGAPAAITAMVVGPLWHGLDGELGWTGFPWITSLAVAVLAYVLVTHRPRLMGLAAPALLAIAALSPSPARAQIVNTQPLLAKIKGDGFSGELKQAFEWRTGNVELLRLSASLLALYRACDHTLLSSSNIEYGEKSGDRYLLKSFSHLRYQYRFDDVITWESYAQVAHDEFRRITVRALGGTGPRLTLFSHEEDRAALGAAYMFEFERYADTEGTTDSGDAVIRHRGSFYLDARYRPTEDVGLQGTLYFQPVLDDWRDVLVHLETQAAMRLVAKLALTVSFTLSWDATPLERVKALDTVTLTGLSWTF
jgi:Na+/proline symporter